MPKTTAGVVGKVGKALKAGEKALKKQGLAGLVKGGKAIVDLAAVLNKLITKITRILTQLNRIESKLDRVIESLEKGQGESGERRNR